jgi:hypothetical protein
MFGGHGSLDDRRRPEQQRRWDRERESLGPVRGTLVPRRSAAQRPRLPGWGTNTDLARLDVSESSTWSRTPRRGRGAGHPSGQLGRGDADRLDHRGDVAGDQPDPREEVEDVAKARLELVEGGGAVWLVGGQEREVRVYLDPVRLPARGLTVTQVRDAIQGENRNTRGGNLDEGRRRYVVRPVGQFTDLDQLRE